MHCFTLDRYHVSLSKIHGVGLFLYLNFLFTSGVSFLLFKQNCCIVNQIIEAIHVSISIKMRVIAWYYTSDNPMENYLSDLYIHFCPCWYSFLQNCLHTWQLTIWTWVSSASSLDSVCLMCQILQLIAGWICAAEFFEYRNENTRKSVNESLASSRYLYTF